MSHSVPIVGLPPGIRGELELMPRPTPRWVTSANRTVGFGMAGLACLLFAGTLRDAAILAEAARIVDESPPALLQQQLADWLSTRPQGQNSWALIGTVVLCAYLSQAALCVRVVVPVETFDARVSLSLEQRARSRDRRQLAINNLTP